jgi:hypothetical protein
MFLTEKSRFNVGASVPARVLQRQRRLGTSGALAPTLSLRRIRKLADVHVAGRSDGGCTAP